MIVYRLSESMTQKGAHHIFLFVLLPACVCLRPFAGCYGWCATNHCKCAIFYWWFSWMRFIIRPLRHISALNWWNIQQIWQSSALTPKHSIYLLFLSQPKYNRKCCSCCYFEYFWLKWYASVYLRPFSINHRSSRNIYAWRAITFGKLTIRRKCAVNWLIIDKYWWKQLIAPSLKSNPFFCTLLHTFGEPLTRMYVVIPSWYYQVCYLRRHSCTGSTNAQRECCPKSKFVLLMNCIVLETRKTTSRWESWRIRNSSVRVCLVTSQRT